jgi:hypothetical protein
MLARLPAQQIRRYMREQTPHNNIIALPVMNLLAWAAAEGTKFAAQATEVEAAAQLLHDMKICQIVIQQMRNGPPELRLKMTEENRAMTDDQITARLFPERN